MTTTKAEAGRKGGFRRWAKHSQKERSAKMKKVAQIRWDKYRAKQLLAQQSTQ